MNGLVGAGDLAADPIQVFGHVADPAASGPRCWRSRKSDDSMTPSGLRSSWPMLAANWPMVASRSALRFFCQQILAVGLQHDGELEVEDLVQRRGDAPRGRRIADLGPDDVERPHANAVHRREHELLRQRDAHVDAADAGAQLEVRLVVRPEQQLVDPADQRLLEPLDLRGAAGDGGAAPGWASMAA